MKKITMQEFADMLGVYVARNEYCSTVSCFQKKPSMKKCLHTQERYWWEEDKNHIFPIEITPFISDAESYDFDILVEPKE